MDFLARIQPIQLDTLKEIGNIGAGHAATSLSKLLGKTIEMKVPSVEVTPFGDILALYETCENEVAANFFRIKGDLPGYFIITFPIQQADDLIANMVCDISFNIDNHDFLGSDVGRSAYMEIGNILAGTYLSALSDFTRSKLELTPPELMMDMTSTVITEGLLENAKYIDFAIIVETTLVEYHGATQKELDGHFFLLPHPESLTNLFKQLGVGNE